MVSAFPTTSTGYDTEPTLTNDSTYDSNGTTVTTVTFTGRSDRTDTYASISYIIHARYEELIEEIILLKKRLSSQLYKQRYFVDRHSIINYKSVKHNYIHIKTRNSLLDRKRWTGRNFKKLSQ